MYVNAIRKILTPLSAKSLSDAKHIADNCKADCFTFNGEIYVKVENDRIKRTWCSTPFSISDFEVMF